MNLGSICLPLSELLDIIPLGSSILWQMARFHSFHGSVFWRLSRITDGSGLLEKLGFSQMIASAGSLSACEILSVSLRVGSVCYSLCLSHMQSPGAFRARCPGTSFWGRIPELVRTLCPFGGNSATVIILLYVGQLPSGVSPDYTSSLTLLSISVVPSLFHYGF